MKIAILLGTRPETIKVISVIQELRKVAGIEAAIWSSGQHPTLVNRTLEIFGMRPDLNLEVFRNGQSPSGTISRIITGLEAAFEQERPDWILVQGDTSTAIAGAWAGFYEANVKVAHLEAGLRSPDRMSPFPEEAHRRLITVLADLYFAQHQQARSNLIDEGVDPETIFVVGNPGLDLLVDSSDFSHR
jgi:UDP-N-acetylglucosamine 2-epimerase (non-hydrolysing)